MGRLLKKALRERDKGIAYAQRAAENRERKKGKLMGLIAAMDNPDTIVEEAEVKGKKVVRVVEGGAKKEDEDGNSEDRQSD